MADMLALGSTLDEVSGPLDFGMDLDESMLSFISDVGTDFILGTGKVSEKTMVVLDVDKMISSGRNVLVDQLSQKG